MEEVEPAPETKSTSLNVELDEPEMQEEISLTLTRAQLTIINEFLKEHIQPKGYDMISFAYDLFKRLHEALEKPEEGAF